MVINKLMYKTEGKNHEVPETEELHGVEITKVVAIFLSTGG